MKKLSDSGARPTHPNMRRDYSLRTHNVRTKQWSTSGPIGTITRGTTGFNRLRRSDRWTAYNPQVREVFAHADHPLAVDVGYGAHWTTTVEWAGWLRRLRPDVEVVGVEIEPSRIFEPRAGVRFELGGFELGGYRPHLVRAFNVLRQYDVDEVGRAWQVMRDNLADGGLIVEGTCDELGRHCAWVLLSKEKGPESLTLAWKPGSVELPSEIGQRLPKVLIHRNVPGEAIHALLQAADSAWLRCAAFGVYGPRMRWRHALRLLAEEGVPVLNQRRPVRDCVLTVPWEYIDPVTVRCEFPEF